MSLQAVLNVQTPVEHSKEVNDCKNLIKTLVMGNYAFPVIFILLVKDSVNRVHQICDGFSLVCLP